MVMNSRMINPGSKALVNMDEKWSSHQSYQNLQNDACFTDDFVLKIQLLSLWYDHVKQVQAAIPLTLFRQNFKFHQNVQWSV